MELSSLISAQDRDFLIRSNGDQVKISSLTSGKKTVVGLYFSAASSTHNFTPTLLEAYTELSSSEASDFEVVFVSSDKDVESFTEYFSKMPWLAIPFSESDQLRATLRELFKVQRTPHLVLFDSEGRVACRSGVEIIRKYGAEAYPFTEAKLRFLTEEAEIAKLNQSLCSLLVSPTRDYLVSNDGTKTDVLELEGKMVCLYVSVEAIPSCAEFTPKLVDFYNRIKGNGVDDFEVVLVSIDSDEETFRKGFEKMPWLALPFKDRTCSKLLDYFQLRNIPTVIVIGPDGKTVSPNVAQLIQEFGIEAYPFSPDKFAAFEEMKKAEAESQTLESILVHGDTDFLVDNCGTMVPVGDLVGKTVLLYFSANWCPPCRKFTPKLIQWYYKIKAKDGNFEVVYLSRDEDENYFNEYFSTMPWLAVPFNPEMRRALQKKFGLSGIPAAVAIGPSGRTLTTEAREALTVHGTDAYPFTEEHLRKLDEEMDEQVKKRWPERVRDDQVHEHELVRKKGEGGYMCRGCEDIGGGWSYGCKPCDFDVHLECGVKEEEIVGFGREEAGKDGWVCEGDVCRKA